MSLDQEQREIRRKRRILEHARETGNIIKTCRYFGLSRSTFYLWERAYDAAGEQGLIGKKPIPHQMPNQTPSEVVAKGLHLRLSFAASEAGEVGVAIETPRGPMGVRRLGIGSEPVLEGTKLLAESSSRPPATRCR